MAFVPLAISAISAVGATAAGTVAGVGTLAGATGFGASLATGATILGGGALAAKSLSQKAPKAPAMQTLPNVPNPQDSLSKAKQDAADRVRMIAATGGQTQYAGMGSAAIDPSMLQRKTLLGA